MINFYFVGRAVFRQKRIDRFKEFALILNEKNIEFKIHFFSRDLPDDMKFVDNIILHGYKKDWINYIASDYIMLLFSDYEGCPLCILEANKIGFKKAAVIEMPGINNYVSSNCIFNNVKDLASCNFKKYNFENTLDLSTYFDENRFNSEVSMVYESIFL